GNDEARMPYGEGCQAQTGNGLPVVAVIVHNAIERLVARFCFIIALPWVEHPAHEEGGHCLRGDHTHLLVQGRHAWMNVEAMTHSQVRQYVTIGRREELVIAQFDRVHWPIRQGLKKSV